ncbi:ribose 5-phosphate isomerase B [Campylobacter sputorum subsp. bubulus]|uniref:Ribose 5-phosphate isomerase B n=1 Tax=Campylobacter sputorum subsp. sputorum TaxID=32024 RepID=A0A381DHA3_9BACT|nr:ribose 5-phosphate isomerase B [Campylobacter sputorum]ASM34925.1 allose-6-phosphate isomerase / ribose-5-phosphate isomerase B [Campylobacter sputorum aubsp. sputorum RM3237]KAB0581946.1 ribose 5-phosphate isomerase B [Campylobacter sputorum subsp. sputorum]QEL05116.1 allose-6-phosphate isomerase / ribose-5-phosphate isomerase B [Campylobacter sputorum subsp. sputorum]SUX09421.1 ribose 5-phosphate isomerase B [Campylobacter sputorum subsp. sputorum]SUX30818.1 ribose 5-phosphate isomerase B
MKIKEIFIASDHAGFEAKEYTKNLLLKLSYNVVDLGCDNADVSVDYPDFAKLLSLKITDSEIYGVLICGSGIGISIAANRHNHIRCALCHDTYTAKLSRLHNDANVLAFGGRILGIGEIKDIVETFFSTEFEGGRHQRRIDKLKV